MYNIELNKSTFVELNPTELHENEGGNIFALLGMYIAFETAGDPQSAWNSFMAGWNAR